MSIFKIMPELKPCPKCGKHPVSLRHISKSAIKDKNTKPYAVCCGGDGCCFYVMGDTAKEAIKLWNEVQNDKSNAT